MGRDSAALRVEGRNLGKARDILWVLKMYNLEWMKWMGKGFLREVTAWAKPQTTVTERVTQPGSLLFYGL